MSAYRCELCGWAGDNPSITDASREVEQDGAVYVLREHLAVCPKCFKVLAFQRRGERPITPGGNDDEQA